MTVIAMNYISLNESIRKEFVQIMIQIIHFISHFIQTCKIFFVLLNDLLKNNKNIYNVENMKMFCHKLVGLLFF